MTWVKLDDGFFSHPKAVAAGKDGRALYLAALCWSKRHLTDGCIPAAALAVLCAEAGVTARTAEVLVSVGLWQLTADDGWYIAGYHDAHHNDPAEAERERKRRAAERQKKWREEHRNGDGRFVT